MTRKEFLLAPVLAIMAFFSIKKKPGNDSDFPPISKRFYKQRLTTKYINNLPQGKCYHYHIEYCTIFMGNEPILTENTYFGNCSFI